MTEDAQRTIVIGGGLGGLAAACTLAARGHSVELFERNAWLGGKAAVLERDGFRFDMGPTIVTLPSVLKRILGEADRTVEDTLPMVRLDPQWRCFFDDGVQLDLVEDTDRMADGLRKYGDGEGYLRFMELSQRLDDLAERYFFWKPIGSLRDMVNVREALRVPILKDILHMRMGWTVTGTIGSFLKDHHVRQMSEHFTQYVGSSPLAAPAILCSIAHMQTDEGIWYPTGGTAAVPRALAKLAGELGVEIRTGVTVKRILYEDGRATGVVTDSGQEIPCAAVVSDMDSVRTHRELIEGKPAERFLSRREYEPACSGVVLYLALDRRYDHLLHHNFVFSRDPAEEFEAIYKHGEPAPDPTCYVCAPAATEAEVAPAGGEALYVLVHTPYLRARHNWSERLPRYRDKIIRKLATTGGMKDIEDRIVFEESLTPEGIKARYSTLDGAIYGLASHGRIYGAFKPSNRSPDLTGLYQAGGASHPGPGMPMALMSGWIAADALDKDRKGGVV